MKKRLCRAFAVTVLTVAAAWSSEAAASDWGKVATISSTLGIHTNRLCLGEGLRATDIGCPTYAPYVDPSNGHVGIGTVQTSATLTIQGGGTTTGSSFLLSNGSGAQSLLIADNGWAAFSNGLSFGGNTNNGTITSGAIFNSTGNAIKLGSSGGVDVTDNSGVTYAHVGTSASPLTYFAVGSGSGNVGISNSNPIAKLDVWGSISASDAIQVGQSNFTCINQISGSIRFNATSNTLQVCTNSGWVSLSSGTTMGGTGVSAMSSLTDVRFTNLAGRDYLRYDSIASKWVNISESTVMSTTTMTPNVPDAIMCLNGAGTSYYVLYLQVSSNGSYQYGMPLDSSGNRYYIQYGAAGAYSSQSNFGGFDCVTNAWSLSQLYANGRAFNFIGSASTSTSTALGDRISSGTLAITANSATSTISLTTVSTTWGYLGSGANYLPNLTSNAVSSTTIGATAISASYVQIASATNVLACTTGVAGTMRYTSGTMQVCDGSNWGNVGIGIPTGTIAAFATTSCPNGWSEYTASRGRFLRGIDNGAGVDPSGTRVPGNLEDDALQNITGTFGATGIRATGGIGTGAFTISGLGGVGPAAASAGGYQWTFNAGNVARTSTETRPANVAVTFCQYNGYQSQLSTGVATLASLSDVDIAGAMSGTVLAYNGSSWVASTTTFGGGAGVSAMSSLTDVALTNLAGRDYLRYDSLAGKWVNISESTAMSTTTMVPNWPDAIKCTTSARGEVILMLTQSPATDGKYYYVDPQSATGTTINIGYSSDGNFSVTNSEGTLSNCNVSIADNYAKGRAFNFIGSANTSASTALGDRITSGTLAMTANSATSYISLSTGGSDWGYLNSGNSFLPNLSANKVSSTNISTSLIQVGNSGAACSTGLAGGVRYNTTSNTIDYCSGSAWLSLGPSATQVPAFSVTMSANQTGLTANTAAKLAFDTETFDTNNNFDTTAHRFTPTIAGKYLITLNVPIVSTASGNYVTALIEKDGGAVDNQVAGFTSASGQSMVAHTSAVVDMNGTTDYIEGWGTTNVTSVSPHGSAAMSGFLITMNGTGTGGGTGVSAMSSLTDVQLTNLAGRDYLRYDTGTSKWVNISESTVMSTTTMINGWPDAIVCNVTNPAHGKMVLQALFMPFSGNGLYYYGYNSTGTTYEAGFTSAGAFSSYSGITTSDCNVSMATLAAQGRTFNYIGSANTSASTALGDRITSGTLSVIANTGTAYVSLSTNGTTWGYLTGAATSFIPELQVNSLNSGPISGTVLQTGTFSTACGSGLYGAIRWNATSDTIQICNTAGWTSMASSSVPNTTISAGTANYGAIFSGPNTLVTDSALYIDRTNHYIGIGTSSPAALLHVSSSLAYAGMTVQGGTSPSGVNLNLTNDTGRSMSWIMGGSANAAANGLFLYDAQAGTPRMTVAANGNVAIGNNVAPKAALDVVGTISASDAIQVGASSLTCGSGITGAIRYNATSDTLQICPSNGIWTNLNSSTTGALNDRITSGTLAMIVNSATSFISLSTGTTNWGYLNSAQSFLPWLSANGISSTAVSATNISGTLIQVGRSTASCVSGLNGSIRYNSISDTLELCSSAGWTSVGSGDSPTSSSVVAFSVTKNGTNQSGISDNTATKLTWSHEDFDTNNNFASNRFTPTVPGKYLITLSVGATSADGTGFVWSSIYKNGTSYASAFVPATGAGEPIVGQGAVVLDMNGTTDYVEAYGETDVGKVDGDVDETRFTGVLLSPQSGGGGGGAIPAGSTNDVQFNSGGALAADSGDFTYASNVLTAPTISTGGLTVTGAASLTNVSASALTVSGNATVTGNATAAAFLYSSDKRLKHDINPLTGGLTKLDAINPVSFKFISDTTQHTHLGVIAQDVEKVYPEVVHADDKGMKSVDYSALVGPILDMLKELKAIAFGDHAAISKLQTANDNLFALNHHLEDEVRTLSAANDNLVHRLDALENKAAR